MWWWYWGRRGGGGWGWGGVAEVSVINILYAGSRQTNILYPFYIFRAISIFLFFLISIKSTKLGFKITTSLVVKCQISHTL